MVFINEEMVQKISSECPLLEEMIFSRCLGLKKLCISKALKMKIMYIGSDELQSVEIIAMNLQDLDLEFFWEEIPLRVFDIIGCSQLKMLKYRGVGLMDQQFHYFISSF